MHAIRQDVINFLKRGHDPILKHKVSDFEKIEFDDICVAVNENDPLCTQVIKDATYYTGIGLLNLIHVLFPDLIILSGPTYTNMNLFYDVVTETVSNRYKILYPDRTSKCISSGNLGENAAAIGAGGMVFNYYLN